MAKLKANGEELRRVTIAVLFERGTRTYTFSIRSNRRILMKYRVDESDGWNHTYPWRRYATLAGGMELDTAGLDKVEVMIRRRYQGKALP